MQLNIKLGQDYVLIGFKKNCNLNQNNTEPFKSQVLESISGKRLVVLDMARLDFIDSAGLTMLIYMRRQILDQMGALRLANVGNRIKKLMQITRLHRILDIYATVEDAIRNGKKDPDAALSDQPHNLRFQVRHTDEYSLIKVSQPDSLIAANQKQFENKIIEYLKKYHKIILNFDQIRNIDSAGIASLLRLKETTKESGSRIILVTNNAVLERLFKLYAMEDLFPKFRTNARAIKFLQDANPRKSKGLIKSGSKTDRSRNRSQSNEANSGNDDPMADLKYDDILFLEAQQK